MEKIVFDLKKTIEVKRFYFDGKMGIDCPSCNSKMNRDFSSDYLSYPAPGNQNWYFYCHECDCEYEMPGELSIQIGISYDKNQLKKI
jgi:hypothetical protein